MQIQINDAYIPLLSDHSRWLLLKGGASSGKSVFAAKKILLRLQSEYNHLFYCFRKVQANVEESIWTELMDGIDEIIEQDPSDAVNWEISKHYKSIKYLPTNGRIRCRGLDQVGKMKSVKGVTGMWLDEIDQFQEEDIDQLNLRIRGKKENYIQYIGCFNPVDEDHWLKAKFFDNPRPNVKTYSFTYQDNYFLTEEDKQILEDYKHTNQYYYQVYCLGEWGILDKSSKFLFSFNSELHVEPCKIDSRLPLGLSFDFNLDPFTCLVYQRDGICFRGLEEIRLSSDIDQVCDYILAKYPPSIYFYQVTGDATGNNQTGVVRGKTSYYRKIKTNLELSDGQFRLRRKNIGLIESKILCNAALQNYDVCLDPSLVNTINDAKYAKVDDRGILVKDRDKNKNDHLDGLRYALDCEFQELTRKPKKK